MATSLGVPEEDVRIDGVIFDVKSVYVVGGITLQEWLAVASPTFHDTMRQRLGFSVNVTRANVSTGDVSSLDVMFVVQGIKDVATANSAKAEISKIAMIHDKAKHGEQGSAIEHSLLEGLPTNATREVQVRLAGSAMIEAIVQFHIKVPLERQPADLMDSESLSRFSTAMQGRGLGDHDTRFYLPPIIFPGTANVSPPPPGAEMTVVFSSSSDDTVNVSALTSSIPPADQLKVASASAGVGTNTAVFYAFLALVVVAFMICCCCVCCISRRRKKKKEKEEKLFLYVAPLSEEDKTRSAMREASTKMEIKRATSPRALRWSEIDLIAAIRAKVSTMSSVTSTSDTSDIKLTIDQTKASNRFSSRDTTASGSVDTTETTSSTFSRNAVTTTSTDVSVSDSGGLGAFAVGGTVKAIMKAKALAAKAVEQRWPASMEAHRLRRAERSASRAQSQGANASLFAGATLDSESSVARSVSATTVSVTTTTATTTNVSATESTQSQQYRHLGGQVTNAPWFYLDPSGSSQGPFQRSALLEWHDSGFFPLDLPLRPADAPSTMPFVPLAEMLECEWRYPGPRVVMQMKQEHEQGGGKEQQQALRQQQRKQRQEQREDQHQVRVGKRPAPADVLFGGGSRQPEQQAASAQNPLFSGQQQTTHTANVLFGGSSRSQPQAPQAGNAQNPLFINPQQQQARHSTGARTANPLFGGPQPPKEEVSTQNPVFGGLRARAQEQREKREKAGVQGEGSGSQNPLFGGKKG